MKSRLMKALGMLSVTAVLLVAGFVWFLKATMDDQNTVVDSKGHKLTVDLPGSISTPVEWMRSDWMSIGDGVSAEVYNSATPAYPACTDEDLKKEINATECSIVLSDRCSPQVRFIRFVARSGDTGIGATVKDVLFRIRDNRGPDFLRSTCNGGAIESWTKPIPNKPDATLSQTPSAPAATEVESQQATSSKKPVAISADHDPVEIFEKCPIVPNVAPVSVAFEEGAHDEFSLRDCGGASVFVLVLEKENDQICSLDFTLSDAQAFKIRPGSSKTTISTSYLPGSNGESSPWTVQVFERNGSLVATSADGGDPKVACESR
jgi:hypothetical protein